MILERDINPGRSFGSSDDGGGQRPEGYFESSPFETRLTERQMPRVTPPSTVTRLPVM